MKTLIIGRDVNCDYVIYDPEKRVSRKHVAVVLNDEKILLKDMGSANGTYLNGKRLTIQKLYEAQLDDKITLSFDYKLDLREIVSELDDKTLLLPAGDKKAISDNREPSVHVGQSKAIYRDNGKTIVFDRDKTTFGELLQVDNSPYKIIGRNDGCDFKVDNPNISRKHCRIRLISNMMLEIEDLGSTNGTFADGERLVKGKKYQFDTSVRISLGKDYWLELVKLFPSVQIIKKQLSAKSHPSEMLALGAPATPAELKKFSELRELWDEYVTRQNEANNISSSYAIGGSILGMVIGAYTGGLGGILLTGGGGVLGRYFGQQESSKIRQDLSYEEAFLQTYCCPRCQESFQKKPWVTIRDCFKCKIKLR